MFWKFGAIPIKTGSFPDKSHLKCPVGHLSSVCSWILHCPASGFYTPGQTQSKGGWWGLTIPSGLQAADRPAEIRRSFQLSVRSLIFVKFEPMLVNWEVMGSPFGLKKRPFGNWFLKFEVMLHLSKENIPFSWNFSSEKNFCPNE